jgi:hypothetical protein
MELKGSMILPNGIDGNNNLNKTLDRNQVFQPYINRNEQTRNPMK